MWVPAELGDGDRKSSCVKNAVERIQRAYRRRREARRLCAAALLSLADLWEVMATNEHGQENVSINVSEFLEIYAKTRKPGLHPAMRDVVPMRLRDLAGSEDVPPHALERLTAALREDEALGIAEVRARLASFRSEQDGEELAVNVGEDPPWEFAGPDYEISYRHFKRMVELMSCLMLIDEQHIISQMSWEVCGRFEMNGTMAALLMERIMHKQHSRKAEGKSVPTDHYEVLDQSLAKEEPLLLSWIDEVLDETSLKFPDKSVLKEPFALKDFNVLVKACGIIDHTEKRGLLYGDVNSFFYRTTRHMPELKQAHDSKRRKKEISRVQAALSRHRRADHSRSPSPQPPDREHKGHAHGTAEGWSQATACVTGRREFEILMEELWRAGGMRNAYRSPLVMVLSFLGMMPA